MNNKRRGCLNVIMNPILFDAVLLAFWLIKFIEDNTEFDIIQEIIIIITAGAALVCLSRIKYLNMIVVIPSMVMWWLVWNYILFYDGQNIEHQNKFFEEIYRQMASIVGQNYKGLLLDWSMPWKVGMYIFMTYLVIAFHISALIELKEKS